MMIKTLIINCVMIQVFFFIKVISMTLAIIITRSTLPRFRSDQFLFDSWKEWVYLFLMILASTMYNYVLYFC